MTTIELLPPSFAPGHLAWSEQSVLPDLVKLAQLGDIQQRERILLRAQNLIQSMRARAGGGIAQLLQEYSLSTAEGVALLSLAEALLRIPDARTVDELIRDKLTAGNWHAHLGAGSAFVNAASLGLSLSQTLLRADSALGKLLAAGGEPILRKVMRAAMQMMASQFVMGPDIENAVERAAESPALQYSFDMLGEGARTAADAQRYRERYRHAIRYLGAAADRGLLKDRTGISVKLSALHPRYEPAQFSRAMPALLEDVLELCRLARDLDIPLTVDAEEAERLDFSLDIFKALAQHREHREWDGLGLAVQAYQKRARAVIDWLQDLAQARARLQVRLVKGAYWDTEIKRAQERGLENYPVFTRKAATDVCYLACAKLLLASPRLRPAFATHNALTVATLIDWAGDNRNFEFQRLHGMGEGLYEPLLEQGYACRLYAPVGSHEDLLAYLVRRLLENGANTSFVHQLSEGAAVLANDPVEQIASANFAPHPKIPLPQDIYRPVRKNSRGMDLNDGSALSELVNDLNAVFSEPHWSEPLLARRELARADTSRPIFDPADNRRQVGAVVEATPQQAEVAANAAAGTHDAWSRTPVEQRAACLERAAELLEADRIAFMALAIREAGKTIPDAVAEVREAVDYCYYYAAQARKDFAELPLPGPTGESNTLTLAGRGPFVCISPWNFPLAIFMGQIAAALAAGCTVLAKPAPQTPLIAARAVRLLHKAGVPENVLQLLPGGERVGAALIASPHIRGVAFTGSTDTARKIAQALAQKSGPLIPFIAETGGQNAMIVDSSALPEQVVNDVLVSAFQSAGQRCSALRVLYLQAEIAPRVLEMLKGAMDERVIGDPMKISTDIGPIIDRAAQQRLLSYLDSRQRHVLHQIKLGPECEHGTFVAPTLLLMGRSEEVIGEIFGPIVHVLSWKADELDEVLAAINRSGYGLTLGVHSRIGRTVEYIRERARVGNLYVNRSMIGAVVGVQPFGGEGLSGTGPKAGGPHYLQQFATERTISVDTTSSGGNATLMSLD